MGRGEGWRVGMHNHLGLWLVKKKFPCPINLSEETLQLPPRPDKAYLFPAWALVDTDPFLSPEWSWKLGNGLRVVV